MKRKEFNVNMPSSLRKEFINEKVLQGPPSQVRESVGWNLLAKDMTSESSGQMTYPYVEGAVKDGYEALITSLKLCSSDGAQPLNHSDSVVQVYVFQCFDQSNKRLRDVKIASNLKWQLVREKISQVIGVSSVFTYLNRMTEEVIVVRYEADWEECRKYVGIAKLEKLLEIVIIPVSDIGQLEGEASAAQIEWLDTPAPKSARTPRVLAPEPPAPPPPSSPAAPPAPPTPREPTPREPTLQEEFPDGSYQMAPNDFGQFFEVLGQIEDQKKMDQRQYEVVQDMIVAGDKECERAYQRYKKNHDLDKLVQDLLSVDSVQRALQ